VKPKPGARLCGESCDTEVVVVRAPDSDVEFSCCGTPMTESSRDAPIGQAPTQDGEPVLIGKRYVDETSGSELLCTKAGMGPLRCDGRTLEVKSSKPLPSSD
jgi:hypothetical protein